MFEYIRYISEFYEKYLMKPYKCSGCGKSYKYRRNLQVHMKNECGKLPKWNCPFCDHRSHRKFNLNLHIKHIHNSSLYVD